MLASGFTEIASLAAGLPFLTVLADPARLWAQPWVRSFAQARGFTEPAQLVPPATLLFAAVTIASGGIRLVNLWLSGRVAAGTGSDLSQEAYRRTLHQPYSVHVARNSATITTAILSHIDGLIYGVISPLLAMAVNLIVLTAISISLVAINPAVALLTITVFGGTYLTLSFVMKAALTANSQAQAESVRARVKNVQEGLGAIRDVLLDRSQHVLHDACLIGALLFPG